MLLKITYYKILLPKLYNARFFLLGLAVVIYLTSQLVNINSIRNSFEHQVELVFHRQISFSHLFLSLNFKGIYIGVDNLKILDLDKTIFLNCQKAQVGVAVKPLFQGKIKIKFLSFNNVVVNAQRLKGKIWNFSDLLDVKTYAKYFELKNAHVYFHDCLAKNSPDFFPDCDLDNVDFNYSINKQDINFQSNFVLNQLNNKLGYVSVFGICYPLLNLNCVLTDFSKDSVNLLTQLVNKLPGNLIPPKKIEQVNNLKNNLTEFKLKSMALKIHELDSESIRLSCKSDFGLFTINNPNFGIFHVRNFKCDTNFLVNKTQININKLIINAPGLDLNLKTSFDTRTFPNPKFNQIKVQGSISNFLELAKIVQGNEQFDRIYKLGDFAKNVQFNILSTDEYKYKLNLSIENLITQNIIALFPHLTELTKVKDDINIKNLKLESNITDFNQINISSLKFQTLNTIFTLQGNYNFSQKIGNMLVKANNLALTPIYTICLKLKKIFPANFNNYINLKSFRLTGFIDLNLNVLIDHKNIKFNSLIDLRKMACYGAKNQLIAQNVYGKVNIDQNIIILNKLSGKFQQGDFKLDTNYDYHKNNLDKLYLTDTCMDANNLNYIIPKLNLSSEILNNANLQGVITNLVIDYNKKNGINSVQLEPGNLVVNLPKINNKIYISSGKLSYINKNLILNSLKFIYNKSNLQVDTNMNIVRSKVKLNYADLRFSNIEISEIYKLLNYNELKALSIQNPLEFLSMQLLSGNINGKFSYNVANNKAYLSHIILKNLCLKAKPINPTFKIATMKVDILNDKIIFNGDNSKFLESAFNFNGNCSNWNKANYNLNLKLNSEILASNLNQILSIFKDVSHSQGYEMPLIGSSTQNPAKLISSFEIINNKDFSNYNFKIDLPNHNDFIIDTNNIIIKVPSNDNISINGSLNQTAQKISLNKTKLQIGKSLYDINANINLPEYQSTKTYDLGQSQLNISIASHDYVSIEKLAQIFKFYNTSYDNIVGDLKLALIVQGKLNAPQILFQSDIESLKIPGSNFEMANASLLTSGSVSVLAAFVQAKNITSTLFNHKIKGVLKAKKVILNNLLVTNLKIPYNINLDYSRNYPVIDIEHGDFVYNGGNVTVSGSIDQHLNQANINCLFNNVNIASVAQELSGHSGEITGSLTGKTNFTLHYLGNNLTTLKVKGNGQMTIINGTVTRFGPLVTKINQANLIEAGVMGFNFNNLIQSVAPMRSGKYKKILLNFDINNNLVDVSKFLYDGDDLTMFGTGKINLALGSIDFKVVGNVPKSTTSALGGTLSHLFNELTPNKLIELVTLKTLDKLPTLPILGDLASDRPQNFTFNVLGPFAKSSSIAKSIEMSFHWLNNNKLLKSNTSKLIEK